ncbi:hypothetical protein [Parapedobacter sp.]
MKRTIFKSGHCTMVMLLTLILLVSCDRQTRTTKDFVWDEDVKELTGGSLHTWLQKAPFDNELDRHGDGVVMITNASQVFPFMGRYYNAVEELGRYYSDDTVIFQETEILFQDSLWGDLLLHATLLYDDQEVFLSDSYYEMGSPLFGGVEAVTDMHESSLSETAVVAKHPGYKTGIYWAWANYQHYLLGFYQQGQLVFETVVPLRGDTLATLDKLKEINQKLGLNIPEWENARIADLQRVEQPKTFWQDPFVGIYPSMPTDDVYLKTKDTPFVQDDKARKGDYYFSYPSEGGDVFFYTMMQQTELNMEDFNKANKKMAKYQYSNHDIFYEEHPGNGYVNGLAKTYFKGNRYLEIHFGYPEKDREAKQRMHDVIRYVKMLNYEG